MYRVRSEHPPVGRSGRRGGPTASSTSRSGRRRGMSRCGPAWLHAQRVTKRAEYTFALYAGRVADPGDRNPYAGRSLVLAKLWLRGYMRTLQVRINSGPAMPAYLAARARSGTLRRMTGAAVPAAIGCRTSPIISGDRIALRRPSDGTAT